MKQSVENILKVPPYAEDAEQAVLGTILMDSEKIQHTTLTPEMFYFVKHQIIFKAMLEVESIDMITISEHLGESFDEVGGLTFLAELSTAVPSSSHLASYEKIVKNKWKHRRMIEIGSQIEGNGYSEGGLSKALSLASELEELQEYKIVKEEKIYERNKIYTWGTDNLDHVISPIEPHAMIIVAGEAGSGKTAWTFFMALQNAKLGIRTMYISLEMDTDGILTRVAREYAGITKAEWRDKETIPQRKIDLYLQKKNYLEGVPNLIPFGFNEGEEATIDAVLRVIKKESPDLVFVDNIGCLQHTEANVFQSELVISNKARDYAKYNKTPIVLLHHYKKGDGKNKVKSLDDLRGNSAFRNDAHDVIQVLREKAKEGEELSDIEKKALTIIQIKDRGFGSGGSQTIYFNHGDFSDSPY